MFAGELIAIAERRTSFESEPVLQALKGGRLGRELMNVPERDIAILPRVWQIPCSSSVWPGEAAAAPSSPTAATGWMMEARG